MEVPILNISDIESWEFVEREDVYDITVQNNHNFFLHTAGDPILVHNSGKTEFAMEVMFYLSETYGLRHALYVPDVGNYKEIRRKLLHKYTGKTLNKKYENYIKEDEILMANAWLDHHFIILQKVDVKKPVTPVDVWDFVADYEDGGGVIHTALIDSWKNLYHNITGREDQYLDYMLSYRNELAEAKNKHFFTIAHATKTEIASGEKKRRVPDALDIKGGGSWFASGKVIVTVDYPDKERTGTDLYFSKVKPDVIGKAGTVLELLNFDWKRSRYYEVEPNYMNQKFYAGELAKRGVRPDLIQNIADRQKAINEKDEEFTPAPF